MSVRGRAAVIVAAVSLASACGTGLRGRAYTRLADGAIGGSIAGVELTFISENGARVARTTTDGSGRYSIALPSARYYARAAHRDFEDYWSGPGLNVVSSGMGTMNVFLREPQVTTVLVVRHGEKQNPASNDPAEPLSASGAARADALRDELLRAGVTAVYSTDTVRTRNTVEPLRSRLELTTALYATPAAVASAILADHRGDVVVVAAHSDTVAAVANALGGSVATATIGDFDNLYAVARVGSSATVVNLQYGADSTPDLVKNSGGLATLLLVRQVATASPPEATRLLHACRKAGITAIHVDGGLVLVGPLATALGLTPQSFTAATLNALVDGVLASPPAGPVLIVGSRQELNDALRRAGAPATIIYDTDRNNLVSVTRLPSGAARATSLLY